MRSSHRYMLERIMPSRHRLSSAENMEYSAKGALRVGRVIYTRDALGTTVVLGVGG